MQKKPCCKRTQNELHLFLMWFIETLGNDVYQVTVTNFNVTLTPDLRQKTVDIAKGSSEWIIKETGVPGVYRFVVLLLTLTLTETWIVADLPVARTCTRTLNGAKLMRVTYHMRLVTDLNIRLT